MSYSFFGLSSVEYPQDAAAGSAGGVAVYTENWLDQWLVALLTRTLASRLDVAVPPRGRVSYDTFVRVADEARDNCSASTARWLSTTVAPRLTRAHSSRPPPLLLPQIARGRTAEEQHQFVGGALLSLLPHPLWAFLRLLVRLLTWVRFPVASALAVCTVPFAGWLVGPAQVEREPFTEEELADAQLPPGVAPSALLFSRTVLHKCRYLEASNCKSSCVNICKVPTQTFFQTVLGVELHMKPDFETKSCALCFGQPAPPLALDPAMGGLCFADCRSAQRPTSGKSELQTGACTTLGASAR